ncbi:hypothetical protein CXB51_035375 [Gossypium anomalum]|uniref:Uncharacterized protein n=1 Tax=Gossypium anomalum TaxID=47600 RepID=A0A8J5XWB4_9ROSI|nr:hypothetical protein CXB51_035375 [Gossypium anomalum]
MDVGEFIVPVPYVKQVKLGESVGTQSRGLTQELISLLPVSKYNCSLFSRKKSRKERYCLCFIFASLKCDLLFSAAAFANKNDIDQQAVDTVCALNPNSSLSFRYFMCKKVLECLMFVY